MRKVTVGDWTMSAQGLGCMGMSEYYGPTDWDVSIATIRHALDCGITLFDTADLYGAGHNEVLLGRALAERRDEAIIATKFGVDRSSGDDRRTVRDAAYVRRSCDASLLRLGTDRIDLYYLHRPPLNVPIEVTIGAMGELVDAGKVRHLGVCEVDAEQLRRAHAVHPVTIVQSEYSLWSRDVENIGATLRDLHIGLVAYSPLGRGFLGGIKPGALAAADSRRSHPRFQGRNAAINEELVAQVAAVASRLDVTPAQVALAWVLHQSSRLGVPVIPIPGTRRPARVDENVAAVDLVLEQPSLDVLESLAGQVAGARFGALQSFHDDQPQEGK